MCMILKLVSISDCVLSQWKRWFPPHTRPQWPFAFPETGVNNALKFAHKRGIKIVITSWSEVCLIPQLRGQTNLTKLLLQNCCIRNWHAKALISTLERVHGLRLNPIT